MEEEKQLEIHEHSFVSGPRMIYGDKVKHSHEGGEIPHEHKDMGPSTYIVDKSSWLRNTGLKGGGTKQFSKNPRGEQFPIVKLSYWQTVFRVVRGINSSDKNLD